MFYPDFVLYIPIIQIKILKSGGGILGDILFAIKKIKKIYPLHIITLLVVATIVLLSNILNKNFEWSQIGYLLSNILLAQSWIPFREGYFSFNAVSWYLSDTLFLYLLFPWFLRIIRKNKVRAMQITIVSVVLQLSIAVLFYKTPDVWFSENITKWIIYICPLYRVGDFLVGCMAGYVFLLRNPRLNLKAATVIEAAIIIIAVYQIFIYTRYDFWQAFELDLYWIPVSMSFVFVFASCNGWISKTLSKNRGLVFVGNVSPQSFLIHKIVIELCRIFVINKIVLTIVSFIGTLLCSVIFIKLESFIRYKIEVTSER